MHSHNETTYLGPGYAFQYPSPPQFTPISLTSFSVHIERSVPVLRCPCIVSDANHVPIAEYSQDSTVSRVKPNPSHSPHFPLYKLSPPIHPISLTSFGVRVERSVPVLRCPCIVSDADHVLIAEYSQGSTVSRVKPNPSHLLHLNSRPANRSEIATSL